MRRNLLARPRLAAAAVVSFSGGLLVAGSAAPAHADCIEAYVWVYYPNDPNKHYVHEDECVHDVPLDGEQLISDETFLDPNPLPEWLPEGAGYKVVYMVP